MSSDDLTSTGDYSEYDILEKEKDTISEKDCVWVKTKKKYLEEEYDWIRNQRPALVTPFPYINN